uniref:KAP family P-loop domain-containing protein n=1 Tax=Candidatus Kentrum sp. TUN TaxID=2126343 RepID=A0A450ZFY9_9GAMM|nr:MAG: KAP family P-loop domain-containing protein [Candidatus Kentron sp. TUN]VFK52723.1 MAG: KAP family P-loop domain-containing protein [Candidatus Kentron sp. TUN]
MVTTDNTANADAGAGVHKNPPRYRNDLWTLDDGFSLGRVGDQVARMALEVEPPFTLGVTGKWGAGKTSVMRRAFATLGGQPIRQERTLAEVGEEGRSEEWENLIWTNEQRVPELDWPSEYFQCSEGIFCIWFSPWQHQNEENPLIPLVREIQAQFQARLQHQFNNLQRLPEKTQKDKKDKEAIQRAWPRCRSNGLAAIKLLGQVGDAALSLTTGSSSSIVSGTIDAIQGWREERNTDANLTELSDGQRFHLLFEDAIDQVLETLLDFSEEGKAGRRKEDASEDSRPRLIFFIDDLDRCEEAVIVRLLEAIKLYLVSHRCVFVLGLDDSAVLDALTRHWQRPEDNNREYLEKLFQAVLSVPLPAKPRVRKAVANQLDVHRIPFSKRLAEDIEQLLEPNPRKIKNFVNGFCATWALHDAADWLKEEATSKVKTSGELPVEEEHERAVRRFLLFHYLRLYHRPVWRLLERQPWSLAILRVVIKGLPDTEPLPLPAQIDRAQQRLLREFYFRAFSHVLAHPAGESDIEEKERGKLWHGNESLDEAVKHFQERQDRKRSDEYLCRLFRALIPEEDYQFNDRYFYLDTGGAPY